MDDAALIESFEEGLNAQVREAARKHTSSAISTLAKLMKGAKTPPNVKRQCAMDLLSQAWGRPDAREDTGGQKVGQGLTVNVIRLYDGSRETIDVDVAEAKQIAETIDAMEEDIPQ